MATCDLTGKKWMNGNRISHSNIKTKHKLMPNIQKKRIYDIESGRFITLKISTRALRTLNRKSLREMATKN